MFDGWCASRSVDPLELPWSRFLNLVYYFITRNLDKDKKKEVDDILSRPAREEALKAMAATRKNALRSKQGDEQTGTVPTPPADTTARKRNLPPRPPGWGDDETNAANAMLAFKQISQTP